jgi:hypothetical protein
MARLSLLPGDLKRYGQRGYIQATQGQRARGLAELRIA